MTAVSLICGVLVVVLGVLLVVTWARLPDAVRRQRHICVCCCYAIEPHEAWTDRGAGPEHVDCSW